jgi:hypothetical protein
VDFCSLGGSHNFFEGGINSAVSDIVLYGIVEQRCILGNNSDGLSQRLQSHVPDILAVDEDPTGLNIVETEQQSQNGGFSCILSAAPLTQITTMENSPASARTDNGIFLSGRNGKADVFQNWSVRVVSKGDVLELDLPTLEFEGFRVWRILDCDIHLLKIE